MAKFWCISAPLYSHTDWGGFLPTAQALLAHGNEVTWISEPRLSSVIHRTGLEFQPIEKSGWLWPPPPPPDFSNMPPQDAVALRYIRALDTWLSEDLIADAVTCILNLADEVGKPDAILLDPFLSAGALAAEKLDVPLIVCGWTANGDLDSSQFFPVQRDLSSDSQQRIQRLCDQFDLEGSNFSKGSAPAIVSPSLHVSYFTANWYAQEGATLLSQNQFVGGKPPQLTEEPPDWLNEIPQHRKLALITLGTTFTGDLGFYAWAAQAAAEHGLLPIVAIGWNPIEPEKKQELVHALPKGTRLLNFVPFDHVLPRCSLMIHHGGMGTTHAAVIHAVPQIVVPHAADQRIQARRVAQARIGLELNAHDVRQGKLREATKAILEADFVHGNARALADEMARLGGVERAAELVLKAI